MTNTTLFFASLLALAQTQTVVPVSDDIHSEMNGSIELCSFSSPNVANYEAIVRASKGWEELTGSPGYTAIALPDHGGVITFTTPENRAFPAAVCRKVVEAEGGGSTINMQIICDADRESCDWLFWEFQALNQRINDDLDKK